ncbi:thioredoxin-disulfide reductase [Falseniella ignava]|uniref:Thioredoxin reductase n=1 Tax=Falseniella ignava TaxID=137730 RepID=A0A2I1K4P5_9LACT|nr:thioredoxin-disulfide reductase [Falseniella ignava]PKY90532.1 thioredoxin-disulfide reductase [Falseniella ignava]
MTSLYNDVDVLVVGAGPGGLTAAQYASRANLKTVIVEQGAPGGELLNTADVENYPGFTKISGPELATKIYDSSMCFGAQSVSGYVADIVCEGAYKIVTVGDTTYRAKAVIIATGATHRELGLESEKRLTGKGVSYCAVCDGFFFRNRDVVVVGGGDSAVEEGTFLTQFVNKVTLIHRRDQLRAQQILQDRLFANEKVEVIWNSEVKEIKGDQSVSSVLIENTETGEQSEIPAEGVFIYVGMVPNSQMVAQLGVTNEEGWIVTNERMETTVPGLFAVGDVRLKHLRQIATAVGDGSIAGQAAYEYLQTWNEFEGE